MTRKMSHENSVVLNSVCSQLKTKRPATRTDLKNYIRAFLDISIPDKSFSAEHSSPLDYLWHAFAEDEKSRINNDAVIWANRAGGKTMLAAVATLLDCIFKPGCQVRILAGSGDQAGRMYDYLCQFIGKGFADLIDGRIYKGKCTFKNGSKVEVLTQSAKSVRGRHVQKLRCDEVELFDKDVFAAAQFITQSKNGITAGQEILSTMHKPFGLMSRVIKDADRKTAPLFKWSVWEVIEKCRDRNCSRCPLSEDCRGKAKKADGYLKIDDCISIMQRSSRAGWESEMLCRKPNLDDAVFEDFDPDIHVADIKPDGNLPTYRTLDFGFVNPFVCFWIQVDEDENIRVIEEYVKRKKTVNIHAENIKSMSPVKEEIIVTTFCDPAGAGRNDVTGTSAVKELRGHGIKVKYKKSGILEGIELIRRSLKNGKGKSRILISSKCGNLIEAFQCYHYPENRIKGELPEKDGVYDHYIDALRYFFVNYQTRRGFKSRIY